MGNHRFGRNNSFLLRGSDEKRNQRKRTKEKAGVCKFLQGKKKKEAGSGWEKKTRRRRDRDHLPSKEKATRSSPGRAGGAIMEKAKTCLRVLNKKGKKKPE